MGSSTFSIWGDWLKEWDEMNSLAKLVETLKEYLIFSYTH